MSEAGRGSFEASRAEPRGGGKLDRISGGRHRHAEAFRAKGRHRAPEKLRRDLRRYSLERTFRHQFNTAAARKLPPARQAAAFVPYQRWQRVRPAAEIRIGLAAAKHAHRIERRRHQVEERQRRRIDRARARAAARTRDGETENRIMTATGKPLAPMSRAELYRWHRENGTLNQFYQLFPK